ncbi:spermatogenesis-associated protein 48 [Carcharodon carcharias]|uniref:spermatogenesis-associated protein 48 n=1 Tax=Carcharodon carcharias TaxID=13397 RepID=UPI001B7F5860|nr:spermatogenesis-associated protein 48 [Carcharodon carcharias]
MISAPASMISVAEQRQDSPRGLRLQEQSSSDPHIWLSRCGTLSFAKGEVEGEAAVMAPAVSLARPAAAVAQTVVPYVRGPEDRHFFTSFQEQDNVAFARWNPDMSAPDEFYPLAPHRHEVQLLDVSSGFKSPGASAETGTKRIPNFAFYREAGGECRAHTAIPVSSLLQQESHTARWNSRSVSAAAVRARVGGWTSPVRVTPSPHLTPDSFKTHTFNFNVDPSVQTSYDATSESTRDATARKYMYATTTQRSYEDVNWDCKLAPKIKPADTTQDKIADPMSRHATLKRYDASPHMWQAVSGHGYWDKTQSRPFSAAAKPINFTSLFPRIHQIPLYSGSVGGNNLEDVDNPYTEFNPYTVPRTEKPRHTDTTHCPNIPGYTGKRQWTGTETNKANFSRLFHPPAERVCGIPHGSEKQSKYRHQSPFSKMITTVSPYNPFNTKTSKAILL